MSAATSSPICRAASMRATISGMRPQLALPAAFRCQISTGMCASRPMRKASSSAASMASPSSRMCEA